MLAGTLQAVTAEFSMRAEEPVDVTRRFQKKVEGRRRRVTTQIRPRGKWEAVLDHSCSKSLRSAVYRCYAAPVDLVAFRLYKIDVLNWVV